MRKPKSKRHGSARHEDITRPDDFNAGEKNVHNKQKAIMRLGHQLFFNNIIQTTTLAQDGK
jgi:hypothetical protein